MYRAFLAIVAVGGLVSFAKGEIVEFVVNPILTQWSMRGAYYRDGHAQGDLAPQFPGSQTTSLTGILRVDLTPTTIQPLPQQPGPNGAAGSAPADYGMTVPSLPAPVPLFAARDFGFTLSSPAIPLVEFESRFQFTEDIETLVDFQIHYDLGTAQGSLERIDWSRGFDDDHVGRLITAGGMQRIELQNYLGDIFALQSPSDSYFEWAGPIVATRVIPEPNGVLLAAMFLAASGLGGVHRQVRRGNHRFVSWPVN